MPHDIKFEVLQKVGEEHTAAYGTNVKFFKCPNGHPYGIGDCTRPNQKGKCLDCGAAIGAQIYNVLQQGNVAMDQLIDGSRTGIVKTPHREGVREMNLFETEMASLLIHVGGLAATFSNRAEIVNLFEETNIEDYLFREISIKIRVASRLSGHSQDDVTLLLLLLIRAISTQPRGWNIDLLQKTGRSKWEEQFVRVLKDVLAQLPEKVALFKDAVRKDSESSALQKVINCQENSNLEKLLRVRLLRVNADTIQQWITSNGNDKLAPTLNKSLKMLDVLEELANLPSILQLQEYLLAKFSGKISRTETESITINDFSARICEGFKQTFCNLVDRLLRTWDRIKNKVMEFGGVLADDLGKLDCYNNPVNPMNNLGGRR